MKKNMGNMDRTVRVIIAAVIAALYFTGIIEGTIGVVLLALAAIFLATSMISFCPIYKIVGLSTCSVESAEPES